MYCILNSVITKTFFCVYFRVEVWTSWWNGVRLQRLQRHGARLPPGAPGKGVQRAEQRQAGSELGDGETALHTRRRCPEQVETDRVYLQDNLKMRKAERGGAGYHEKNLRQPHTHCNGALINY